MKGAHHGDKGGPSPSRDNPSSPDAPFLRSRAEEKVKDAEIREIEALSPEEIRGLVHELRVHQIELEMQNENLKLAQRQADEAQQHYSHLFHDAPWPTSSSMPETSSRR